MMKETLLPVYVETSPINIISLVQIILFHGIFIIGNIYFAVNNCNSPDTIIDLTAYFSLDAVIQFIWAIYICNLIIKKQDVVLSYNCDAYIFGIYMLFIITWNMLGAFILSDLMNYSCNVQLYNYLFAKIIINYFYCVYKVFIICF